MNFLCIKGVENSSEYNILTINTQYLQAQYI